MFVLPHQTTHYENRIYAKNFDAKLKVLLPTDQQSEVTCYWDKENILERFSVTFTANGNHESVSRDQVFSWIVLYCSLLQSTSKWVKKLHVRFVYNNYFGLFLTARFLFWEILNLNLTFAVCRKRHSKSLFYHNYERREKAGLKCLPKNNIQLQFTSHFLRRAAAVSSELCKI